MGKGGMPRYARKKRQPVGPWLKRMAGWLLIVASIAVPASLRLSAAASPANIITYQGRILNTNGIPVTDTALSMKFFLYSASSGGTCVWSNSSADCDANTPASTTARSVTLTDGLFTENLGDTSDSYAAIASTVFGDDASVYLEVKIGSETLTPRKLFTAAPYALNAQTLDGIDS